MQWILSLLGLSLDQLREERIRQLRVKMEAAPTRQMRLVYWNQICEEIKQRSPKQVARMTQEKKLV